MSIPKLHVVHDFDTPYEAAAKMLVNFDRACRAARKARRLRDKCSVAELNKLTNSCATDLYRAMAEAAANPEYANDLVCWSVTLSGPWLAADHEQQRTILWENELLSVAEQDEILTNIGGPLLVQAMRYFLSWSDDHDVDICTPEGWSLSALEDNAGADRLCALIHREFCYELRSDQLLLTREYSGFQFRSIPDPNAARAFLRGLRKRRGS